MRNFDSFCTLQLQSVKLSAVTICKIVYKPLHLVLDPYVSRWDAKRHFGGSSPCACHCMHCISLYRFNDATYTAPYATT